MDIPTPPASSIAPSTHPNPLPQPRKQPLKPGGPKETQLINYLDQNVLRNIRYKIDNRTWRKTHVESTKQEEGMHRPEGYATFTQAATDLEGVVDVIWVSGSPKLQVPYLLTVCSVLIDALPLFPAAHAATFALLEKLDFAFRSLLVGQDSETGAVLSGFEGGWKISTTERVRIKSAIETARAVVVNRLGDLDDEDVQEDVEEEMGSGEEGDDENEIDGMGLATWNGADLVSFEGFENNSDEDEDMEDIEGDRRRKERQIAKVFERTLVELGDLIGDPIGIITDN
jgi:hypothetical protein